MPDRRIIVVVCSAAAALTAGCAERPDAQSGVAYFPLAAGHHWAYAMTAEFDGNTLERESVVLSALGRESIAGGPAWRRRSASGVDYWLRADAGGIYRVASKTDLEAAPQFDAAPRYVLKAPLAVGTTWQAATTAYLLRRRQTFPPEIRHTQQPVAMTYRIEALGQKVDSPAGQFNDCIRVRGLATMHLFVDPVNGVRDLPLTTLEWYCKEVGLVRLERNEPASSTSLYGGKLKMELTEWQ